MCPVSFSLSGCPISHSALRSWNSGSVRSCEQRLSLLLFLFCSGNSSSPKIPQFASFYSLKANLSLRPGPCSNTIGQHHMKTILQGYVTGALDFCPMLNAPGDTFTTTMDSTSVLNKGSDFECLAVFSSWRERDLGVWVYTEVTYHSYLLSLLKRKQAELITERWIYFLCQLSQKTSMDHLEYSRNYRWDPKLAKRTSNRDGISTNK